VTTITEENHIVEFDGYIVDLFKTETGSLGITVERKQDNQEKSDAVDIFVTQKLEVTHDILGIDF